jgi:uncharacterized membrane protein
MSDIRVELHKTPIWKICVLGSFNLANYALMLKALTLGEASRVMPIVSSTTPLIIIFSILLLGEKKDTTRKLLAGAMTVGAIYLLR